MAVDRYQNSTNYEHPQESNLLNVHKSMEYDSLGRPAVRTILNTTTVQITGPVNVFSTVTQGTSPWVVTGTIFASNFTSTVEVLNTVSVSIVGTPTVDIGIMPEVEIKNDIDNPIPISKNTSSNSSTNPIWVKGTSDTSFFDPTQSDAFGRLRISDSYTLFDSFHRYQDNGLISIYTTGTNSTSTHEAKSSSILMSIGTGSGAAVYRESNRVFPYQPGKSLLILTTFCMSAAIDHLRQRIGYFDVDNGVFLERTSTGTFFVIRSSSVSPRQETRVESAGWDHNPGVNTELAQIVFFDLEWLGVGSVRCGFVINGKFVICHTFHHANTVGNTTTYMTTACLPVRAEIENLAATTATSTYRQICTSVISEGGYEPRGRSRSVGHPISSAYTLSNQNTVYPIFSMRLKNSRLSGVVLPKNFTIGIDKSANYRYTVVVGGVTAGGTWVDAGSIDSSVEYNLTGTSITGGTVSEVGYINATNQSSISPTLADFPFKYQLEKNSFLNTGTEFTITLETDVNTGPKSWCSVNWEEPT